MIEVDLRNHLINDAEVKAIIETRVFPLLKPQGEKTPCIVYTVVNDKDKTSLQGENYSTEIIFQLDCYDSSYSKVKELKAAVKNAMYKFKHIPHNFNARDVFEQDTKLHRQLIEFKIIT